MKKPGVLACLVLCVALLVLSALAALAAEAVTGAPVPGADVAAAILDCLPASWGGWVTLVVSVCAAVSAFWGRPSDSAPLAVRLLYAVVNAIGFNVQKAANADDAGKKALRVGKGGV